APPPPRPASTRERPAGRRVGSSHPGLLREREPGDEGHEPYAAGVSLHQPGRAPLYDDQLLGREVTDRDHETTAGCELLREWFRHSGRRGRHDDALERRALGPAGRAVAQPGLDVGEAESPKSLLRFDEQVGQPPDRVDARGAARQDRRLVTGAGADLEHAVPAPWGAGFGN